MKNYVVEDFKIAIWLIWQGTLEYLLLLPLLAVVVWSLWTLRGNSRARFILFLPVCWLLPVALAGAFTDWSSPIMKTASWIGFVGLAALVVQTGWSLYAIVRMKGLRWLALAGATANMLIALPMLFVVAMDASGDWI